MQQEFINSIEDKGWEEVMVAIRGSEDLLKATMNGDDAKAAETLELIHRSETSIMAYNDENSLASVISPAYYSARRNYVIYRELPSGEGCKMSGGHLFCTDRSGSGDYADLTVIPRKHTSTPAMVVELKVNRTVETALSQIK